MNVATRCVPVSAQEELQCSTQSGTKVVVRNLFGNMPVRVKQRALLDEAVENAESSALVLGVIAYQLAWKKPVTIRILNNRTGKVVNLQPKTGRGDVAGKTHTATMSNLDYTLSLLTQASLIAVNSWQSWVPISAMTSSVKIKGAISLDPCPTKHYQFIAVDIRPILHEARNNVLYDEINRLFQNSRFGVMDDAYDEAEIMRRSKDRRYKQDGMTNKLLKHSTKGVDRWPMFDLHIDHAPTDHLSSSQTKTVELAELQSILKVTAAMTTQWLAEHGFRPRRKTLNSKSAAEINAQTSSSQTAASSVVLTTDGLQSESPKNVGRPLKVSSTNAAVVRSSSRSLRAKDTSLSKDNTSEKINKPSSMFQTWSRIKSGRPGILAETTTKNKVLTDVVAPPHEHHPNSPSLAALEDPDPIPDISIAAENDQTQDTWTTWQDPDTCQLFRLNTRSGLLVPAQRPRSAPGMSNNSDLSIGMTSRPSTSSSLRLESRAQGRSDKSQHSPWLKNLAHHWENPVFQTAEQPVEHVSLAALENDHIGQCTHNHDQAGSSLAQESRLSAHNLRKAKLISQLDNKFILIKMPTGCRTMSEENTKMSSDDDLLVIVDQHAADERCKVEELLSQLCAYTTAAIPLRSNLGHEPQIRTTRLDTAIIFETSAAEAEMLKKHAAYFAKWGILYDILPIRDTADTIKVIPKSKIVIRTLPPVIVERCTAEPRLIIELLRAEAWQRGTKSKHFSHATPALPDVESASRWLKEIGDCPKGILEMVNSRACRSAIMFNDVLNMEECKALVGNLAQCTFPFQCAHGRPSMVPLVSMPTFNRLQERLIAGAVTMPSGANEVVEGINGGSAGTEQEGFVQAFRRWQK